MDKQLDEVWDLIITYGIATDDEIRLVTNINGYNMEALNDIIYAKTGYRDIDQVIGEE